MEGERKGHPPRLRGWDYSTPAAYFVTITVAGRRPLLSRVRNQQIELLPPGRIVERCRLDLPDRFPVDLDASVIMPDHLHAVLILRENNGPSEPLAAGPAGFRPLMETQAPTLGKVVRAWKARSALQIRRAGVADFAWQSRFYETIIRTPRQLQRARAYVAGNPSAG